MGKFLRELQLQGLITGAQVVIGAKRDGCANRHFIIWNKSPGCRCALPGLHHLEGALVLWKNSIRQVSSSLRRIADSSQVRSFLPVASCREPRLT